MMASREGWRFGLTSASLIVAAALFHAGQAGAADGTVAGWVFASDGRSPPPAQSVRLVGKGTVGAGTSPVELRPCDEVQLVQRGAKLWVKLVNGTQRELKDDQPSLQVPCGSGPQEFTERFKRAIMAFVPPDRAGRDQPALTATRSTGEFAVLGFGAWNPRLLPGRRSLFVAWNGGEAPYGVRLERAGQRAATLAPSSTNRRWIELPSTDLTPGTYTLAVRDATGVEIAEDHVLVVQPGSLPLLTFDPELDPVERGLLEVQRLEWLGDGEWRLEAVQTLAAQPRSDPRVREWLLRWGVR